MSGAGEIQIGTSGWTHSDWRGEFYPRSLKQKKQLPFYADHFNSAEIHKTFKNFPFKKDIKRYNTNVDEDFVFSVCGNKRITHQSGLTDLKGVMNAFFSRLENLDKMDIVIWEIPEKVEKDLEMLTDFLEVLPMEYRHVVEFEHESWYDDEVMELVGSRDLSCVSRYCEEDGEERLFTDGPFVYYRLRGRKNGEGKEMNIREEKLDEFAETAEDLAQDGKDVYAYFLNTGNACAVEDARKLEKKLS